METIRKIVENTEMSKEKSIFYTIKKVYASVKANFFTLDITINIHHKILTHFGMTLTFSRI